ncbi:unnamed protein product [Discula destructiva]
MAPTAPTKRKSLRLKATERLANPLLPRKVHRPDSAVTDTFLPTSKSDKRLIKHSSFVSRITKPSSSSTGAAARKNAKRHARRKAVKAGTQSLSKLDALADALPELTAEEVRGGAAEREGRVRHRSLGSKRGALKKRERVVRSEMERFGASLAQLQAVQETAAAAVTGQTQQRDPAASSTAPKGGESDAKMEGTVETMAPAPSTAANRFAALRGFISATMEQNPAFTAQKTGGKGA